MGKPKVIREQERGGQVSRGQVKNRGRAKCGQVCPQALGQEAGVATAPDGTFAASEGSRD